MAIYDAPRATVLDEQASSVSSYLADQIRAAIEAGAGSGKGPTIVTDFVPGDVVPAHADAVIVRAGEGGAISIPAHVGTVIFAGPAETPISLSVGGSVAIRATEAADLVTVSAIAYGLMETVISIDLGAGDDVFIGAAGARNFVIGGAGDDQMTGGTRDDWFETGQGSDHVDGGAGYDQAFVHGGIDDYNSLINADGSLSLINKASGEITTLVDVEFLTFGDGAVMVNATSETGFAAASLFEVILGRGADPAVHAHFAGTGPAALVQAADAMLGSPEFAARFGPVEALSDQGFLEIIYATAFAREADPVGMAYWLDRLANGTSRAEVAVQFAGSAEAHESFAATINLLHKDPFG